MGHHPRTLILTSSTSKQHDSQHRKAYRTGDAACQERWVLFALLETGGRGPSKSPGVRFLLTEIFTCVQQQREPDSHTTLRQVGRREETPANKHLNGHSTPQDLVRLDSATPQESPSWQSVDGRRVQGWAHASSQNAPHSDAQPQRGVSDMPRESGDAHNTERGGGTPHQKCTLTLSNGCGHPQCGGTYIDSSTMQHVHNNTTDIPEATRAGEHTRAHTHSSTQIFIHAHITHEKQWSTHHTSC